MSLYKLNGNDALYSANEKDEIPIDCGDILSHTCIREVFIHPFKGSDLMCISPNNAAFRIGVTDPVLSFFGCCVITYKDYGRLMISL